MVLLRRLWIFEKKCKEQANENAKNWEKWKNLDIPDENQVRYELLTPRINEVICVNVILIVYSLALKIIKFFFFAPLGIAILRMAQQVFQKGWIYLFIASVIVIKM